MRYRNLLILSIALLVSPGIFAQVQFNTDADSNLAIHGYDPVGYFTDKQAIPGSKDITAEYGGATWAFSSQSNKQAFEAKPAAYVPEYGGYCAYAAGLNALADVDPTAWTIFDGRLYLNYNAPTRDRWLWRRDHYIQAANKNWPELIK